MKLSRFVTSLAAAWLMATLLPACSSGSGFGGAIGGAKKDKEENSEEDDDATLTEEVDEPQQVAGAFLACSYMEPKEDVKATVDSGDPEATVDVGCGMFRSFINSGTQPAKTEGLDDSWRVVTTQRQYVPVAAEKNSGSDLSTRLKVPVKHLGDSVWVQFDKDVQVARRRFSLSTISTYDAESYFDIAAYVENQSKIEPNIEGVAAVPGYEYDFCKEARDLGIDCNAQSKPYTGSESLNEQGQGQSSAGMGSRPPYKKPDGHKPSGGSSSSDKPATGGTTGTPTTTTGGDGSGSGGGSTGGDGGSTGGSGSTGGTGSGSTGGSGTGGSGTGGSGTGGSGTGGSGTGGSG